MAFHFKEKIENEDTIKVDTTDTIDISFTKSVLHGLPIRYVRDV